MSSRLHPLASRPSTARRAAGAIVSLCALIAIAQIAQSYSSSPPLRAAGAPGEPAETQCVHCHFQSEVNGGPGTLTLTPPAQYSPGGTYDITVSITQADMRRWGYELTVLKETGAFIGLLASNNPESEVQTDVQSGITYAAHSDVGTFSGSTSATWTVQWTAPSTNAGPLTVYVAAVAANKNYLSTGDDVYQTSAVVPYGETPVAPTTWGFIKDQYRAR